MKADRGAQLRLLDLQRVDSLLDQLTHRLETLPEAAAAKELEKQCADLDAEQWRLQTDVGDLGREQRKADADVEQVKTRRARNRERLDSGAVGDPKQIQAMQHENETLDRRIDELEEVELEVMERLEAAQNRLAEVSGELADVKESLAKKEQARDAVSADIAAEQKLAENERGEIASEIPADLLQVYDSLRARLNGVGVGAIHHGRCGGCQLDIGTAELAHMRSAPADEVLRCEECNRILVRTDESGL